MKIEIDIESGLDVMFMPFKMYMTPANHIVVKTKLVGFEQYQTDVQLYDILGNPMDIPESPEIQKIVDLYDEACFTDLIHNLFTDHVFQNMVTFGLDEVKIMS